jgi:hypothetical protein
MMGRQKAWRLDEGAQSRARPATLKQGKPNIIFESANFKKCRRAPENTQKTPFKRFDLLYDIQKMWESK